MTACRLNDVDGWIAITSTALWKAFERALDGGESELAHDALAEVTRLDGQRHLWEQRNAPLWWAPFRDGCM